MFLKTIVLFAAMLLNKNNVINYIEKNIQSGDAVENTEKLTRLANFVINELSHLGIYLIKSQTVKPHTGSIVYTVLRSKPTKILSITDEDGNEYEFVAKPEYVEVDEKARVITYAYEAIDEKLDTKLFFSNYEVTASAIGMGVVAEYLLTLNDFDGAVFWHEKFIESINNIKTPKNVNVKKRSFV